MFPFLSFKIPLPFSPLSLFPHPTWKATPPPDAAELVHMLYHFPLSLFVSRLFPAVDSSKGEPLDSDSLDRVNNIFFFRASLLASAAVDRLISYEGRSHAVFQSPSLCRPIPLITPPQTGARQIILLPCLRGESFLAFSRRQSLAPGLFGGNCLFVPRLPSSLASWQTRRAV